MPANIDAIRARATERAQLAQSRARASLADAVIKWRAGEYRDVSAYPDTLLRLSHNGRNVETSRGASVPVAAARNLWAIVLDVLRRGKPYKGASDGAPNVGDFRLTEIRANGTCVVGCHTLEYSETRAFAIAQGWPV